MRCAALLVTLTACYSPSPPLAIPCGENGVCPGGQACDPRTNRCGVGGTDAAIDAPPDPGDARTDASSDARPDATPDATMNLSGCADGQREAFVSPQQFPLVAGCAATWPDTPSLRAPATGAACGDDLGSCAVPADACAAGWHVCGTSGVLAELPAVQPDECAAAGTGRFVAAMSHCTNNVDTCEYGPTLPCFDSDFCSEPVCCGSGCVTDQGCLDALWPGATPIATSTGVGCGMFPATLAEGVLCCES